MDLLLQRFLESRYDQLSENEKQVFAELLEQQDLDIMDWIMSRTSPPAKFESIIHMLRDTNGP